MTFTNNLKITLSKTLIQRAIYLFAFVAYLVLWTVNKNYQLLSQKSPLGFSYWIIDLLVIIPLLFQSLYNNKIGWAFIFVLLCIHLVLTLLRVRDTYDGSFMTIIPVCIFYTISFAIMYYLYPRQIDK
jgi:hypothetical protein